MGTMETWFGDEADFEREIGQDSVCLFEFGSSSCAPCAAIRLKLEDRYADDARIRIFYVPLEENAALAAQQGIMGAPALRAYAQGKLLASETGYFGLGDFERSIERYFRAQCGE